MLIIEAQNESWECNLEQSTRVRPQEQTLVTTLQLSELNLHYSFPKQLTGTSIPVPPATGLEPDHVHH